MNNSVRHPFEIALGVSRAELEWQFLGEPLAWADFWLNPRRLRGSDFLMRWSQGVWSEHRLGESLGATKDFFSLPYGPSSVAPDKDVRAFELYFERLEAANPDGFKRPDLLVFRRADHAEMEGMVKTLGGPAEFPFLSEDALGALLSKAVIAVECENSLWKARQMPNYLTPLRPQKRLGGKLGLAKSAVLPTVIIKEEDRARLVGWQQHHGVPIHVWHAFYDVAYGLALDEAERLIKNGDVEPTKQVFQAPGGATQTKIIYKFRYQFAYDLANSIAEPSLTADSITDKNGHILPFVRFEGGKMQFSSNALEVLQSISEATG